MTTAPLRDPLPRLSRETVRGVLEEAASVLSDSAERERLVASFEGFRETAAAVRREAQAFEVAGLSPSALAEELVLAKRTADKLVPEAGGEELLLFAYVWLRMPQCAFEVCRRLALLPQLQAEAERRAGAHEIGSLAATLSSSMREGRGDSETERLAEEALRTIRDAVGMPLSARILYELMEKGGQVPLTVAHETAGMNAVGLAAAALSGKLDSIPASVSRDLANEAEEHRRWSGRGAALPGASKQQRAKAKRALGSPRLEVGLEVDAGEGPKTFVETLVESAGRWVSQVTREEELGVEAAARMAEADRREAGGSGGKRVAQQIRRKLRLDLGGKAKRTPGSRPRTRGR